MKTLFIAIAITFIFVFCNVPSKPKYKLDQVIYQKNDCPKGCRIIAIKKFNDEFSYSFYVNHVSGKPLNLPYLDERTETGLEAWGFLTEPEQVVASK